MIDKNPHDIIAALTEKHVSRITGITIGQLRAWDKRGFFVPSHAFAERTSAYSRIYSFKDAVGLKTISVLRNKYKISLNKLEVVARELEKKGFNHWADTKLYVVKKKVHFQHPGSNIVEGISDGQYAMLEVIDVISDLEKKVVELKRRTPSQFGDIERNKYVARNSWVVSGTRIPTAAIRRFYDAGYNEDQIIEEYPTLSYEDIRAALTHEKKYLKSA